jgi:YbbR-like protein
MSFLRGLLLENLGLKFVALLLAALVYFNAYFDRAVPMMVSFPVVLQDVPDSVSVVGAGPPSVHAEIRGKGKQVLRLRYFPPSIPVSLAGAQPGHFERSLSAADLPLPPGLEVQRLAGPRMLALELDRKVRRRLPVSSRIDAQAAGRPVQRVLLEPASVMVSGPARIVGRLDSVSLAPVRVDGKRDTLRVDVWTAGLPAGCTSEPPAVRVTVVLGAAHP